MKVILATGGSGGHIFPALETALELRKRGHEVFFAGVLGIAQEKINGLGFTCQNIVAQGFQDRSISGCCSFALAMARAIIQSVKIINRIKPDKIIGFGGYGSFALISAGTMLRYPTMIHEQNVVPGKANRILSKCVQKIAVSFKSSFRYLGTAKTVWTGCPCHDQPSLRSREDICRQFGLRPEKKIIALLGGSQGSKRLNEVFYETMAVLGTRGNIQAVHMTGKNEFDAYRTKYQESKFPVIPFAFISPIEELYSIVDIVITRAGAATISELGAFAIPSVLVPYPFAGNHQKYNALVLKEAGAAIMIEQKDLTVGALIHAIDQYVQSDCRDHLRAKLMGLFVNNAAQRLADAVESL